MSNKFYLSLIFLLCFIFLASLVFVTNASVDLNIIQSRIVTIPEKLVVGTSTTFIIPEKTYVQYYYLDDLELKKESIVHDKKIIAEDVDKRKPNARYFKLDEVASSTKYIVRIYSGQPFYYNEGKWFQVHSATTTLNKFLRIKGSGWHLVKAVLADIFDPTVGNGHVEYGGAMDWASCHDATDGNGVTGDWNSNDTFTVGSQAYQSGTHYIYRGFVPIDTSTIGADTEIESASFFVNVSSKNDGDNDAYAYISLVGPTNQSSTLLLATSDYNDNSTDKLSADLDITSISVGYNEFQLTDVADINKTGITKFGLREGHDLENQAITTGGGWVTSNIVPYTGYYDSGSATPYLEVTISEPPPVVPPVSTTVGYGINGLELALVLIIFLLIWILTGTAGTAIVEWFKKILYGYY